jgi:hypothetical protein
MKKDGFGAKKFKTKKQDRPELLRTVSLLLC